MMRVCTKCGAEKPSTDFYKKQDGRLRARCKSCSVDKSPARKSYSRDHHLRAKFGISPEQYAAMLAQQGGACAICGGQNKDGRRLSVDHDHDTGRVRGLLCYACNAGIGLLKDSADLLAAALTYLRSHARRTE